MPLAGGLPARLTFDGARAAPVVGWTPDGEILYATRPLLDAARARSSRASIRRRGRRASWSHWPRRATACYDADGKTLFFTRLAVPGQPHQALQGRHRPEPLAVRRRRRRRPTPLTADLRRHQQDARCAGSGRVYFVSRPRRHHEPVVDGRARRATCGSTPATRGWDVPSPSLSTTAGSSISSGPTCASSTSPRTRTRRSPITPGLGLRPDARDAGSRSRWTT